MDYCEFLDCIQDKTETVIGKGGKTTISHIIKNNGNELDGVVITEPDCRISPTIYLNEYFEQYEKGRSFDDIFSEIITTYTENKNSIDIESGFFEDYNLISQMIVYKVINYEQNEKLLELVPHKKFLDLAVVYYCLLDMKQDGYATALIYNTHLSMWNISEDDIFKAAVTNTPKLLQSCIKPMSELLNDILPKTDKDDKENIDLEDCTPGNMYVLTNTNKMHGASCILYDNVLKSFADQVDRDLYILPSSIHEVILLPKMDFFSKNELNSMVRDVNCNGVSQDEILSDHVYEYNRKSGMIEL